MPDYDEYGIPIKKLQSTVSVDEFDIPIKKKDSATTGVLSLTDAELGIGQTSPSKSLSLLEKSVSGFKLRPITSRINADGTAILKSPDKLYSDSDDVELNTLTTKYQPTTLDGAYKVADMVSQSMGIPKDATSDVSVNPNAEKLRQVTALENTIRRNIIDKKSKVNVSGGTVGAVGLSNNQTAPEDNELAQVQGLKKKLSAELTIQESKTADAILRTDESGNLLNKVVTRAKMMLGDASGAIEFSAETEDKIANLPAEFFTGLNYFKNAEPVVYERVTAAIQNNQPISESQVAQITAEGLAIEQAKLERSVNLEEITPEEFNVRIRDISKRKVDNLVNNKETLRAVLSSGIAEILDSSERARENPFNDGQQLNNAVFGYRWNYDDAEIKSAAERWASEHGLDPTSPNVQSAIKYLQDNEGAMIMQNSIAKNGIVREFAKGAAQPIRGIQNTLTDVTRSAMGDDNSTYVESQSQGNVNVSENRLKIEDTGWRGVVNDITKGTGQFVTQAGIALATSGAIGGIAEGLALTNAGATTAGELIGFAPKVGQAVNATKDFVATLTTSFAQVYDNNLKTALNYTSDNKTAKTAAFINSTVEGLSETVLSPIDVARSIRNVFRQPATNQRLISLLSEENILAQPNKIKDFLTSTMNGALKTGRTILTEAGEGTVTQIADFTTNALLNPESQSYQNRDLTNELMQTAYQTGLSMAIPALLSGIGAGNVNTFSKGSLMIAAQNRQSLLDDLNTGLRNETIAQDEFNAKSLIINTAAKANELLPLKANNTPLTSDEKADYVYSRVSEAVMQKRVAESNDEAEKRVYEKKIKEQQDFRFNLLGTPTVVNETPTETAPAQQTEVTTQTAEIDDTQISPVFEQVKPVLSEDQLNIAQPIITRVNNAEEINERELNSAQDILYDALDKNPDAANLIEPLILKIQNYEFATKTETGTVTEEVPVEGAFRNKVNIEVRPALEQSAGSQASIKRQDGSEYAGVLEVQDGNYVLSSEGSEAIVLGEKASTDINLKLPSEDILDNPILLDNDGNVQSVTFQTPSGDLVTINDADKALDIAIQLQVQEFGEVPDAAFEQAFQTVQRDVSSEVPVRPGGANTGSAAPAANSPQVSLTPAEQAAIDGIQGKTFPAGINNWTNVIQDENAPIEDKKQALKELKEQLADPNSEVPTGQALGKSADFIYDIIDEEAAQSKQATAPTTNAVTPTTVEALITPKTKTETQQKIETFNSKADAIANSLIKLLTPSGIEGVKKNGLGVEEVIKGATSVIKSVYAASQHVQDAIDAGMKYFRDNWDESTLGALPELQVRALLSKQLLSEQTVAEVEASIKKGDISYNDAIDGKSQAFIDDLNKALFGSKKANFDSEAFKAEVRKQKQFGLSRDEIIASYNAAKKLTKAQQALVDEVFGETAERDSIAKKLQEAFNKIAQGEKPRSVLKRLSVSNVTELVSALRTGLTYKAVSNKQLEAMVDYVVDALDISKADQYIDALINNADTDIKQLMRAKMIVALQKEGNNELATKLVRDMATEATNVGRQTQSLSLAYEILGAQGSPAMRTEFARRSAEAVQQKALQMTQGYTQIISEQEVEIGRLNQKIHNQAQSSPLMSKIKEAIVKLCNIRRK